MLRQPLICALRECVMSCVTLAAAADKTTKPFLSSFHLGSDLSRRLSTVHSRKTLKCNRAVVVVRAAALEGAGAAVDLQPLERRHAAVDIVKAKRGVAPPRAARPPADRSHRPHHPEEAVGR
jgi:hypothetical protein